ncbi:MAG TPA: Ni/Fe-hydrogenase, b-type cytochrome subunit [Bryobacteraceae bacterium]|nr:Ni/Fe-hydrogenase, b-type cytochrome subunit [Bryobacteraceae bacterium]
MQLTHTNHTPKELVAIEATHMSDRRHPMLGIGPTIAVYVWQYAMRLFHWGMVLSIAVLSFTGYYIHSPFIVGQVRYPFLMGWFRFVHESFGMLLISLFLLRLYMFFAGNRWSNWRQYVPHSKAQFQEMLGVMKFYAFLRPTPVSKVGHNAMAAFSYIGLYGLIAVEIVTGLVMFNWLRHSPVLGPLVAWIPRVVSFPNLRLIHFFLMFVFLAFAIFHVHLAMLISRVEKRGLIDSIFTGYKVIPAEELEEEERHAIAGEP